MTETCARCAVLEDLLETATSERDKARDEAGKADREALSLKDQISSAAYKSHHADRLLVAHFRNMARELGATPEQMLER
jgi:hypothetical protein